MKNQRGVTLIALVVTIIVLIILAAVSIAILTGDNGIIDRSKEARVSQIEGEVRDMVSLAVASAKLAAEQKSVSTETGFLASSDLNSYGTKATAANGTIYKALMDTLNPGWTTSSSDDYTITVSNNGGTVQIVYITDSYKHATNKSNASITFVMNVTGNKFEIPANAWTYVPAHTN